MAQDFSSILRQAGFKLIGAGDWKRSDEDPTATTRVHVSEDRGWFAGYNNANQRTVCGAAWELESVL